MSRFVAQSPKDLPGLDALLGLSGLDFMCAMRDGAIPGPLIGGVLNFVVYIVEKGRVVFRGAPEFSACNPMGSVHGDWYGALLDSCMACAVMTIVPKRSVYTTLEYKVNITCAIPLGTGILAVGRSQHAGRSTGVANSEIRDAAGTLYATGSTTCIIMHRD